MADHHIDTLDINYSEVAKKVLQNHGVYISSAPPINHKPGNDLISDVYYPLPTYPDTRFKNPYEDNNDIQTPPIDEKDESKHREGPKDFQIVPDELKRLRNLKNPIITFNSDDSNTLIKRAVYPYTGLALQAIEKKAFDISYVKPYFKDGKRKTKVLVTEIITGHFYSIATFDGWNFHIYRGLCRDILRTKPVTVNGKRVYSKSVPFGNPIQELDLKRDNTREMISKNLHIVLDVSADLIGELVGIPVGQILDIQQPNFIYDFTIYEDGTKVLWDDEWFEVHDEDKPGTYFVYVPLDGKLPQHLYHPVIEHQKPYRLPIIEKPEEPPVDENLDDETGENPENPPIGEDNKEEQSPVENEDNSKEPDESEENKDTEEDTSDIENNDRIELE